MTALEIHLRAYQKKDLDGLLRLFYESVHQVAAADYDAGELDAWAPRKPDRPAWEKKFSTTKVWVAEKDGCLAGFANLDGDCFDCLYVAPNCRKQGVASRLAGALERCAAGQGIRRLTVEASRTARPFFERRGYRLVRAQTVERRGVILENFVMEREMSPDV